MDLRPLPLWQPGPERNYSEGELKEWQRRISQWRTQVEVFAYFNNDWEGFAVKNALWLKRHLPVS